MVAHVGVVVGEQHVAAGRGGGAWAQRLGIGHQVVRARAAVDPAAGFRHERLDPHGTRARRPVIRSRTGALLGEGQPDAEAAAPTRLARDLDGTVVQAHHLLHEGEADAGALEGAPLRARDPMEAVEQPRQLRGRDARAGIRDRQHGAVALPSHLNGDAAVQGELEGVREEVQYNLLPHVGIERHEGVEGRAVDGQRQAGLFAQGSEVAG